MEYETSPSSLMTPDQMSSLRYDKIEDYKRTSSSFKLCKYDNVKDFKRSRFDEVESYKQVGHVGSGGYGNCLLLQKRSNQTHRVCKVQKRTKRVPFEIMILREVLHNHPRIVRLNEVIFHTQLSQLYYDYYPGGDLYKIIFRYYEACEQVPESFIWHCFLQLSEALAYIHHGFDRREMSEPPPSSQWQSIIHGDIKPENVFLGPPSSNSNGYPSLVLGDFGLARMDESPVSGTFLWQPPEMPMTSKKADVWALGAVMHALAHRGRPPLLPCPQGWTRQAWYQFPGARLPISLQYSFYSAELDDLVVNGALHPDPRFRYSSAAMLQCVAIEVELGVASDMDYEPLLGPDHASKTYDENGVTERTTASSEETFHDALYENDVPGPC